MHHLADWLLRKDKVNPSSSVRYSHVLSIGDRAQQLNCQCHTPERWRLIEKYAF
jgi:hypothetical protein